MLAKALALSARRTAQSESAPQRTLSLFLFSQVGVWGPSPHVYPWPLTFPAYRAFKSSSTPPNSAPSLDKIASLCSSTRPNCASGT